MPAEIENAPRFDFNELHHAPAQNLPMHYVQTSPPAASRKISGMDLSRRGCADPSAKPVNAN
ncbi:MAG: hypothetical protein IT426_20130 [Pirellulales bacterium]|nr:hypothetical protein [Pirellulales bacterium]